MWLGISFTSDIDNHSIKIVNELMYPFSKYMHSVVLPSDSSKTFCSFFIRGNSAENLPRPS